MGVRRIAHFSAYLRGLMAVYGKLSLLETFLGGFASSYLGLGRKIRHRPGRTGRASDESLETVEQNKNCHSCWHEEEEAYVQHTPQGV